jgi:hypothetical protein
MEGRWLVIAVVDDQVALKGRDNHFGQFWQRNESILWDAFFHLRFLLRPSIKMARQPGEGFPIFVHRDQP